MKVCPHCRANYPSHFSVCPQDGNSLKSVSELPPGTVLRKKYEILQRIGQGGMGTVYKVRHLVFNEVRALKMVSAELAENPDFLERFRTEAVIMRRLQHPNAVRVEDMDWTEDNRPFLVMEYIEGNSLRQRLEERGALPVSEALEVASQTCSALSAAHEMGILHRDIKPDNILIVDQPGGGLMVKVMDFGVAKIKESTQQYGMREGVSTQTGFLIGTPAYMSPEQAMGKPGSQLDARSDLYSVGIVLYEMLTGSQPFSADTPVGLLQHHIQTIPQPPDQLAAGRNIPGPVSDLVMKALEKDPANRFQLAAEMQAALTGAEQVSSADPTLPYDSPAPAQVPIPAPASSPESAAAGRETPTPPSSPPGPAPKTPVPFSTRDSSVTAPPEAAARMKWPGWQKTLVFALGAALALMWKARIPRWLLVGAVALFAAAQLVPVERANPPEDPALTIEANSTMTGEVKSIIHRACVDCHSHRTEWPWYSNVAPVSWFVTSDVRRARRKMNLSEWGRMEPKDADHALDEMCEEVEKGEMPLASYQWMHSEARLTDDDAAAICDWAYSERGRIRATLEELPVEPASTSPPTQRSTEPAAARPRSQPTQRRESPAPSQAEEQRRAQIDTHFNRARRAMSRGEYLKAIAEFEAVRRLDNSHTGARDGLARARKAREAECAVIQCED